MEARFDRFKDAPWFPKPMTEVIVGGAGGIGSWLGLLLARTGVIVHVYDMDTFEAHNMAGQLVREGQINKKKVTALYENINSFCSTATTVYTYDEKYVAGTMSAEFCFSAFDNMEARRAMYMNWKANFAGNPTAIFIDGRLTAEQLQIFCVPGYSPELMERYEKDYLFTDAEVEELACTFKQTSHAAAMIAAHMVGFFTNHLTNVYAEQIVRPLTFFWEYYIPIDMLNQS